MCDVFIIGKDLNPADDIVYMHITFLWHILNWLRAKNTLAFYSAEMLQEMLQWTVCAHNTLISLILKPDLIIPETWEQAEPSLRKARGRRSIGQPPIRSHLTPPSSARERPPSD